MTTATAVVYGLGCALGGYCLARMERRMMAGTPARERWALIARLALAAAIVFFAVYTQVAQARQNACYLDYFSHVCASLADRSAATGRATRVQLDYLAAIEQGGDVDAARTVYIESLQRLELERRAAPLPRPPECR